MGTPFEFSFANGLTAVGIEVSSYKELAQLSGKLGIRPSRPTVALIGGAGGLQGPKLESLRPLFLNELAPLANDLSANIVDGGTDFGVMRLVGEARAETHGSFNLIGVAAQGTVALPGVADLEGKAVSLDTNHTHFVFVPGSHWGDESPWLARVTGSLASGAASVTLLVNGGETARQDVAQSLALNRRVIVLAGSGRLADELAAGPSLSPLITVVDISTGASGLRRALSAVLEGAGNGQL